MLDRVRAEVAGAHAKTHARFARIRSCELAIKAGTPAFTEDMERVRGAEGLPLEAIDSLRILAQSRSDYLNAILDYNKAQFELYVALGKPPSTLLLRPADEPVVVPACRAMTTATNVRRPARSRELPVGGARAAGCRRLPRRSGSPATLTRFRAGRDRAKPRAVLIAVLLACAALVSTSAAADPRTSGNEFPQRPVLGRSNGRIVRPAGAQPGDTSNPSRSGAKARSKAAAPLAPDEVSTAL